MGESGSETKKEAGIWKPMIIGALISLFSTAFGYILLPWADWWNFIMKSPEVSYYHKMHKPLFVYN